MASTATLNTDAHATRTRSSAALGVLTFVILLPFVHGDVTWFDSGELTTAAVVLGVPHPTGFPLLVFLGHLLSWIPLGPVAFRVALLGAGSVALATGLAHSIAVRAGARPLGAAVGALFFPAVFTVWLHGTTVEVYGPNAACIAILAWLLLRQSPRWRTAALCTGLGLGAHPTFPLVAAWLWALSLSRHREWTRAPALVGWFLSGAAILLYLPAAASRGPWLNWGDPSSVSGLWNHLTAAGIRESFATEMGAGGAAAATAAHRWAHLAGGPDGWWVVGLALVAGLWVRPRAIWMAAAGVLCVDGLFSVFLNPMGQADLQTGVPGAWALSLALALAAGRVPWSSWRAQAPVILVAALTLHTGFERLPDRLGDDVAGGWGHGALSEALPGSLVLASSDHLASQASYLQGVEGLRPDVLFLVKQHLADTALVRARYGTEGGQVPEGFVSLPAAEQAKRLMALVGHERSRRPVLWELGDGRFDHGAASALTPRYCLYEIGTGATGDGTEALEARIRNLRSGHVLGFRSRRVLSDTWKHLGVLRLLRAETDLGARALERAVDLDPRSTRALLNLAAARRRQGRRAEAAVLLERAVALDPTYTKAAENLARLKGSGPARSTGSP